MDIESAARRVREEGYTVEPDFLDKETLERLLRDLAPVFEAIGSRMTDDYGQQTVHTHNLLAKTRAVDELLMDERLLGLVEAVLGPDYQVSGVAAMRPGPGDRPQRMHQDDGHYPLPRPHVPLIANTLIALDPFTAENGATEIVPGSHRSADPVDPDVPTLTVEMPAGALFLWDGAVWHRGGGNSTEGGYRRSLNFNFNLAWLKQRENQYVGVPWEVVVEMPEKLQALIGYKLTNRGLGTVDYRNPIETVKRRLAEAGGNRGREAWSGWRDKAEEKVQQVRSAAEKGFQQTRAKAQAGIDEHLERRLEKLGVAGKADVGAVLERLGAIEARLEALEKPKPRRRAPKKKA